MFGNAKHCAKAKLLLSRRLSELCSLALRENECNESSEAR